MLLTNSGKCVKLLLIMSAKSKEANTVFCCQMSDVDMTRQL